MSLENPTRRARSRSAGIALLAFSLLALARPALADWPDLKDIAHPPTAARKDANLKATSKLIDASRAAQNGRAPQNIGKMRLNAAGEIHVDVVGPIGGAPVSAEFLGQYAARVSGGWRHRVEAWVPVEHVEALARDLPDGYTLEPVGATLETLATEGQGPVIMNSNEYRDLGFDGTGITIAVIDVGYNGLNTSIASDDAPAGATYFNYTSDSFQAASDGNHGRFVVETIYDHAPGATYLIMKVDGQTDVGTAVDDAIANGVDIISMSLGWWPEWEDDVDTSSLAFNEAGAAGILAFNSAGNSADDHYQGQFVDLDGDDWHSWVGTSDEALGIFVAPGATFSARLTWDRSGGTHDYDLYLYNSDGTIELDSSTASGETYEQVSVTNGAAFTILVHLAVSRQSGGGTELEIFSGGGTYQQFLTPSSSLLAPSTATHANAISVGAVEQVSYGSGKYTSGIQAVYSSQGPTNEGLTGPDVCAPTSTSGSFFGVFTGTSCACPHAAGVTACAWSVNPAGSPSAVRAQMYAWAAGKDWGVAGFDNIFGRGGIHFPPMADCNSNDWPDAFDIASGGSDDDNHNGRPDECDVPGGMSFGWLSNGPSVPVNPFDGVGTFQEIGQIQPGPVDPTNPFPPVSGFTMVFAYDRFVLDILDVRPAPALEDFLGGAPASFDWSDIGIGVIVECTFGMDPATGGALTFPLDGLLDAIVVECRTDETTTPSGIPSTLIEFSNGVGPINALQTGATTLPIGTAFLGGTTITPTPTSTMVYSMQPEEDGETIVFYDPMDPTEPFSLPFSVGTMFGPAQELTGLYAAIRHDSSVLAATGAVPAELIADLDPELWMVEISASGLALHAQWSTVDTVLHTFTALAEQVATIEYETTDGLFGDGDGASVQIGFDPTIGIPGAANLAYGPAVNEVPVGISTFVHLVPTVTSAPLFKRGDVDGNGSASIGDAIQLLGYLFQGATEPGCLDAADVDDDGGISIGDAISLLSYLFAGGTPPPAPGPITCGTDATADSLSCLTGCP